MDVNNNINNNISSLNQSQNSVQVQQKQNLNQSIEKIENESLSLDISSYNQKRDDFSLDFQSLNEGLSISRIAEKSLDKQQDYIKDIQTKLETLKTDDNKLQDYNDIKKDINEDLKKVNQIAYDTKFKNDSLLSIDAYEQNKEIQVSTKDNNYKMQKLDTTDLSTTIFESVNNSDLNDVNSLDNAIKTVGEVGNRLEDIKSEFKRFGSTLEEDAKANLQEQKNLLEQNKLSRDFGKDSSDFSKTNISANAGYLVASQANIVQEQSVRLLA